MDIYSQLQQEVGAAGGELEPKTRAALISRLDEVLQTLVTRYEPLPGLHQILRKEEGQSWGGGGTRKDPVTDFPCVLLSALSW